MEIISEQYEKTAKYLSVQRGNVRGSVHNKIFSGSYAIFKIQKSLFYVAFNFMNTASKHLEILNQNIMFDALRFFGAFCIVPAVQIAG